MTIGSYNYFEVGAIIETTDIGDCNTFQNRCKSLLIIIITY
jgi:hypothetical protein